MLLALIAALLAMIFFKNTFGVILTIALIYYFAFKTFGEVLEEAAGYTNDWSNGAGSGFLFYWNCNSDVLYLIPALNVAFETIGKNGRSIGIELRLFRRWFAIEYKWKEVSNG
jgi:hypothetical protein